MAAAKTKAQAIINEHPVGQYFPSFVSPIQGTVDMMLGRLLVPRSPSILHPPIVVQSLTFIVPPAVFSKSWCSYSRASKHLLDQYGANYYVIELDQVPDGSAIQSALREMNGQSTVPHIYINKQHIGGNSDLQAVNSDGELKKLLREAGAVSA
jgi:glutaredoxin 3